MAVNEFRQDLVSGDWVLISSLRAKRPHDERHVPLVQPIESCPFEPDKLKDQVPPLAVYNQGSPIEFRGDWTIPWTTAVIPNKYPALQPGACGDPGRTGPYATFVANGFHELVITRDHEKHFAQFTSEETAEMLRAYRDRYVTISQDDCGDYISIIHNHGTRAGASLQHNHSQLISTPIIPPVVRRSVHGTEDYFQKHGVGVHRMMIDWELAEGKRIVYENDTFVAFCPFVSKAGYEVRIFPKEQQPWFELIDDTQRLACADALNTVLRKLFTALGDPDYNFYIHTAPVAKDPSLDYRHYHWHIEVLPRIPVAAGFELSTAVYINPFDPDECAQQLRDTAV